MSIIYADKQIAESMVECRDRLIREGILPENEKITYAGRLDPMATGKVLFLTGEDVHKKEEFCNMNKVYEIEVFSGLATDTGDVLGRHVAEGETRPLTHDPSILVGVQTLPYPSFSSQTHDGKALWAHAREGNTPEVMNSWEIYNIEHLGQTLVKVPFLVEEIKDNISSLKGDFRQKDILSDWDEFLENHKEESIYIEKYRVSSSSGAYMRQVAEMIGAHAKVPVLALSIHRIQMY